MRSRTKKYKRLISVLCSILLACNVSSCGYGESDTEVITIWSSSMSSKMILEKIVDGFNRTVGKTNGIFIDYHTKDPLTFGEEITKAFESGNPPDLFAGFSREYAQKGYVVPICDIEGGREFLNEFKDIPVRTENSLDGKIYCTPISVTTHGLLYNKEMFKKAGLTDDAGNPTPPETFEQMRDYAGRLTDSDKNEYGIVLPLKWSGWYGSDIRSSMMSSCGYQEFNPVTGKFDYTGAVPIMQTYLDIINDKSCVPGAEQIDNDTARALFASGGVGMKLAFSFDVNVINDQYPASIDWGVAPLPVVDKGNKYKQRMAYGYSFCVTSRAAEKADGSKLIRILKYFNSKEIQKELYISSVAIPYDSSDMAGNHFAFSNASNDGATGYFDNISVTTTQSAIESDADNLYINSGKFALGEGSLLFYNNDGTCTLNPVEMDAFETHTIAIPSGTKKIFFWKDLDTIIPITESIDIE